MILFYQLFLILYRAGVYIVSLWSKKARLWIKGRLHVFSKLKEKVPHDGRKIVWMHSASLGEFEQGRPVLQKIKEKYPQCLIVLTFFSPSGFEIVKKNKEFDKVFYLPMDSYLHAHRWMNILKPDLVLWVKYEYWFHFLREIKRKQIPLLLISGIFTPQHAFFKWYGSLYRKMLSFFSHFFVQNTSSQSQLSSIIPVEKITFTGDTRCDRVIFIRENFIPVAFIEQFCQNKKVFIAGSTWDDDEDLWSHYVKAHPEFQFIIAPHEIDEENIRDVQQKFQGSVLYSDWVKNPESLQESNCLIINNVGMLSRLYHYADIAYVGGGFGTKGLHNILEPAVYGIPVIFGPEFEKNFEAEDLIMRGGAFSVESAIELENVLDKLIKNPVLLQESGHAAEKYIYENAGASEKIISYIQKHRILD